MHDLPHLAARLYGTPLLVARSKLDVILGALGPRLAGQAVSFDGDAAPGADVAVTPDGIAIVPVIGTLVARSGYLGAASGLTAYSDIADTIEAAATDPGTLGDLLKFELNASYTRETVTLKVGSSYPLGSVLGRITASGEYRLSPAAEVVGDEGAEVAIAVLLEAVDAMDAAVTGLIAARGPVIVADAALAFDASIDQPAERAAKITQLAAAGLVARTTV